MFDALGSLFLSIYRVFPRVILRVRGILDSRQSLTVSPGRRSWGGSGGPGGPALCFNERHERGFIPVQRIVFSYFSFLFFNFISIFSTPLLGGSLGGGYLWAVWPLYTGLYLIYLCFMTPRVSLGGLRGVLTFPFLVTFAACRLCLVIVFPVGITDVSVC